MSKTLEDLWPSSDNCQDCLITEAETAADAVFLAVHQPMHLERRSYSGNTTIAQWEEKKESDLLEAFLSDDMPSGTLLLPIVGSSGVGKSHMIRWLDAQMRNLDDGVERHIVRIPKSASLKKVLELILIDLQNKGDAYRSLHKELSSASMPKELDEATFGLLAKLIVSLERNGREATEREAHQKGFADDRERMTHCHPQCLPNLLRDGSLAAHFTAYDESGELGVLARIASRYIQGDASELGPQNQFTEDDFQFGDDLNQSAVGQPVRIYLNILKQNEGKNLKDAVKFLNEVVDQALGGLLDFGGNSLTDLFVRIREQLFDDKIELVLLVEDFATLAGIQGSLLDAIIREGIRDGKQVLCKMRTALAVTEGYLSNIETVGTRAVYEWRISDYPFSSEEEAVETYSKFVGGYLNAARWGKVEIERKFNSSGEKTKESNWLPDYYGTLKDDLSGAEVGIVDSFGLSPNEIPLFPFNSGVIRQLIRRYLKKGEHYVFNPRLLINRVLRDTLVNYRGHFEKKQFPPGDYQDFNRDLLDQNVAIEIGRKSSPAEKTRMEAFVYHWGDDPRTLGVAAGIDERLYRGFDLTKIDWSARPVKQPPPGTKEEPKRSKGTKEAPEKTEVDRWIKILKDWRQQKRLAQTPANKLREYLVEAMGELIDWNSLLTPKPTADRLAQWKKLIFLPYVEIGNPEKNAALAVAVDDDDMENSVVSDSFFKAITAVIRVNIYKHWNYDGGEEDSAAYASLITRMAKQAETYCTNEIHNLNRPALTLLVQGLLIGARILNLKGSSSKKEADGISAIYAESADFDGDPNGQKWEKLCFDAHNARNDMIEALKKHGAARQGTGGGKILAVDAAFLLEVLRETRKSWQLPEDADLKSFKPPHPALILEYLRSLKNSFTKSVEERLKMLSAWRTKMVEWLGEDFELQEVKSVLLDTLTAAKRGQALRLGNHQYDTLRRDINKLTNQNLKESMKCTAIAVSAKDFGQKLSSLAKIDDLTVSLTETTLETYESFMTQTSQVVDEKLHGAPPSLEEVAKRCIDKIEKVEFFVNQLEGGNS